jgi:hypothetical protein
MAPEHLVSFGNKPFDRGTEKIVDSFLEKVNR